MNIFDVYVTGKDWNVLGGLNVPEASGSSQLDTRSTEKQPEYKQLPDLQNNNKEPSYEFPNYQDIISTGDQHTSKASVNASKEKIDFITIPFDGTLSKIDLQMELLRKEIEYTKRDIYHPELLIFERERSLSLTVEDQARLIQNTDVEFHNRQIIWEIFFFLIHSMCLFYYLSCDSFSSSMKNCIDSNSRFNFNCGLKCHL